MQRATTADRTSTPNVFGFGQRSHSPDVDCPVCGEPIRGIAAARPGEHRFVGCDHYASARFLRESTTDDQTQVDRRPVGP